MSKFSNTEHFALYVSSVEGHLVNRYGSPPHNPIGAFYGPTGAPSWDTKTIYPLTHAEVARFGREYRRAIAEGGLKQRTAEEWVAQRKAEIEAHAVAQAQAEEDAKRAAEEQSTEAKAPEKVA